MNDGPLAPKICNPLWGEIYYNKCFDENGHLLDNMDFDNEQPIYHLPLHPPKMSTRERKDKGIEFGEESYQ